MMSRKKVYSSQQGRHKPAETSDDAGDERRWLRLDEIVLLQKDKEHLCNGSWLNDKYINYAQMLLKRQFPMIDGWNSTLILDVAKTIRIQHGVQIVHTHGNHWIVASNLRSPSNHVQIFDS